MNDADKEHVRTEIYEISQTNEFRKSTIRQWNSLRGYDDVNVGDYIKWNLNGKRHGIVVSVDPSHNKLTVIRYCNKTIVLKEDVIRKYVHEIQMKKAMYEGPIFSTLSVVHRATARLGEEDYGWWRNGEPEFPKWCKTGYGWWLYHNMPTLRVTEERIVSASELERGDHLMFQYVFYSHHVIVVRTDPGRGQVEVIHFTSTDEESGNKADIKKEWITLAGHAGTPKKVLYRECATSSVELTIYRAEQIMDAQIEYHLFTSNCEDLATWCKTGVWVSKQAKGVSPLEAKEQLQEQ